MHFVHQGTIYLLPLLPQRRRADCPHRGDRIFQVGGEQNAPTQLRSSFSEPADDAVIERVNRVPGRTWAAIEDLKERPIMIHWEALHFDPNIPVIQQVQHLGQQRESLSVPYSHQSGLVQRELGNGSHAGNLGVVVHHNGPVPCRVYVELDPVRIQHDGTPKGRAAVLVLVAGRPSMSDYTRSSHGPEDSPA